MTKEEYVRLKGEKESLEKRINTLTAQLDQISEYDLESYEDYSKRLQYMGIAVFNEKMKTLPIDENIPVEISDSRGYSVTTSVSRTQIEDMKTNFGIDIIESLLCSVIPNEFMQSAAKMITKKLSNVEGYKIETSEDFKNILSYLSTRKYVITNAKLGSYLQDIKEFLPTPLARTVLASAGMMYDIGKFGEKTTIYVDPYMRWNDDIIYTFDEPFANFILVPNESISFISEATLAPKVDAFKMYANIIDVKSETFVISNDIASKLI